MVVRDINKKLHEIWGDVPEEQPDWTQSEWEIQDTFRESRTGFFAGRTDAISELTAFCLEENTAPRILMLQGDPGSGKSGLLCMIVDAVEDIIYTQENVENDGTSDIFLMSFCCGISSRSSNVFDMLRYFITILSDELDVNDDSDDLLNFNELKDRFFELLYGVCEYKRVVMIIDALDQFPGVDEARKMLWISGRLPDNFRLLCSITDGPELDVIKQFGGEVQPVPDISREDEAAIIHGIAKRHGKQIGSAVVEHILNKQTENGTQAAQNPLYLSLITQNLVMMDRYELDTVNHYIFVEKMNHTEALAKFMTHRIDEIPCDPEGAYLAILNRVENILECDSPGGRDFVRGVLGLIAVSRSGLREADLEAAFNLLDLRYRSADFSWLRQMLRGHFSQGDMQQWDFSHHSMRRAMRADRYDELKWLNDALIPYLTDIADDDYFAAKEIMHHLSIANRPDIAAEVMAQQFDGFYNTLVRGFADVYIENEENARFLLSVTDSKNTININKDQLWCIALLIGDSLQNLPENTRSFRIELMLKVIEMLRGADDLDTRMVESICKTTVAKLYNETGQEEEAWNHYEEALAICVDVNDKFDTQEVQIALAKTRDDFGNQMIRHGWMEDAGLFLEPALEMREKLFKEIDSIEALWDLSDSYESMSNYMIIQGKISEAGHYYNKNVDVCKRLYDESDSVDIYRKLSSVYSGTGRYYAKRKVYDTATEFLTESILAMEKLYNITGSTNALRGLAKAYNDMSMIILDYELDTFPRDYEKPEDAEEFCVKSIDILENIYNRTGTTDVLTDLGNTYGIKSRLLFKTGKLDEALKYSKKAFDIICDVYYKTETTTTLRDYAMAYYNVFLALDALGQKEEAEVNLERSFDAWAYIAEQTIMAPALREYAIMCDKIGAYYVKLEQYGKAEKYYKYQLNAQERVYEMLPSAHSLYELALLYKWWAEKSLSYVQLSVSARLSDVDNYSQKALDAWTRLYELTGRQNSLWNVIYLSDFYSDFKLTCKHFDEAMNLAKQAYDMCKKYVKLDASKQPYLKELDNKIKDIKEFRKKWNKK